jgi:hypothetical protein
MKLTTGILAMAMMVGGIWAPKAGAQNPNAIDNARSAAKSLQQTQANNTNAAPASSKPAPGAPAPAVKPAGIPGEKPVSKAQASVVKGSHSGQHNQLQHVNVVPGTDNIQIEISSSETVTPKVSKLSSPARVVVELPETVVASSQNKIPVGSGGVKGVRIGMDGKNPPTTSVVVDLEKALAFEVAPGPAGKVILIVHTQDIATTASAGAPVAKKPMPAAQSQAPVAKLAAPTTQSAAKTTSAPKVMEAKATAPKTGASAPKAEAKPQTKSVVAEKQSPIQAVKAAVAAKSAEPGSQPKPEEKKWAMSGKRDPFFSPVVQQSGSGCSTGKKCLEIGAINVRGVVKSDSGFIAVVTNNLNKAYFLRENDPVFNGYVVKITGDSVVFQETIQDKLGKSFTREVVKRIITPAV